MSSTMEIEGTKSTNETNTTTNANEVKYSHEYPLNGANIRRICDVKEIELYELTNDMYRMSIFNKNAIFTIKLHEFYAELYFYEGFGLYKMLFDTYNRFLERKGSIEVPLGISFSEENMIDKVIKKINEMIILVEEYCEFANLNINDQLNK